LYTRGALAQNVKLVHDRSVGLEVDRNVISDAKILVLPEVTKSNLVSIQAKVLEGELGRLALVSTVDNNNSIVTIMKRTDPSLHKLSRILGGKTHANAGECLSGRVILPLLVVAAIAGISLNDRSLVVPDVNAVVIHAAVDSGVVHVGPLLVKRLSAH